MSGGSFFGQFLLGRSRISAEALLKAAQHQNSHNLKLGELAVREGLLTTEVADQINLEQRRQDKPFGQIARAMGKLTAAQIDQLVEKQKQVNISIEAAIAAVGAMSPEDLQSELALFRAQEERAKIKLDETKAQLAWASGPAFVTCVQLTSRLLQRVADIIVREGPCRQETDKLPPFDLQFGIAFTGDWGAEYLLRISSAAATKIACRMLGETDPDAALVKDSVKEFANVVCGQVCGTLSNEYSLSCELSPPRELPANEAAMLPGRKIAVFPLDSTDGPIEVAFAVKA